MVVVFGPASFLIAALLPTAVKESPVIAIASAIEKRESTVITWPLTRIVSAGTAGGCPAKPARARTPAATRTPKGVRHMLRGPAGLLWRTASAVRLTFTD